MLKCGDVIRNSYNKEYVLLSGESETDTYYEEPSLGLVFISSVTGLAHTVLTNMPSGVLYDLKRLSVNLKIGKHGDTDVIFVDSVERIKDRVEINGAFYTPRGCRIVVRPEGKKYDSEKVRPSLMLEGMPNAVQGVLKVLEFGAKKYDVNNWQKVEEGEQRYLDALARHLLAIFAGEKIDPESGLPHIDHLNCCGLFISEIQKAEIQKAEIPHPGERPIDYTTKSN